MWRSVMRSVTRQRTRMPPRAIAAVYVVAGGSWIVLSAILLGAVAGKSPVRGQLAILTGWLFVAATGALLYVLLRRHATTVPRTAETMEKVFETAVQGIVVSGRDGRIEQVNGSAEALFGYRRDELIGQPVELVLPADGAPGGAGVHLPAGPGDASVRRVGRRKDGTWFPVGLSQNTVRIGEMERVMSVLTDISARIRGEEAVARLAAIVESSQDAIITETLDGIILTWNAGAERIYGYSVGEVVGQSIAGLIPPELPDELDSILEALRREENIEHYETVRVRKDGQRIQVSLTVSPIRGAGGRVVGVSMIARDVTERVTLERAARRAETLAALGTLSAGIAHEINNPIGILSSRLELMEGRPGLSPELREDLQMLHRNVERVGRIIRSLLSAARQSPMERRPVDLNTVIEESLVLVRTQMRKDQIQIVTALAPSLPKIRGEPHTLQQVLMNLLVNARDAMPDGGTVRIETSPVTGPEEGVRLVVADTGPGIPADVLPRISEPFYTTKTAGTGLGLPLSYNIVREHGGRVEVDSAPGRGTTFIITLPVDQPDR